MKEYTLNKVLSFAAVFLCIGISYYLYGYTSGQWRLILLCIIIFGYSHFLLGFYYQLKSFARSDRPTLRYVTFGILTALSVGIAYLIFTVFGFVLSLFFGFLYFLLHGLLNERTLIVRQTGLLVPLLPLVALSVFIISLLTYAVPDKTFFFGYDLSFYPVSDAYVHNFFASQYLSLAYFPGVFYVGLSVAVVLLLVAWRRYQFPRLVATVAAIVGVLTVGTLLLGAPAYIFMYVFVVGYHFMTWLLFYLSEFKRRGSLPWRNFLLANAVVFGGLLYLLFQHETSPTVVSSIVFDYRLFVVFTYIHITTSFMNDDWCKALELRVFRYLFER